MPFSSLNRNMLVPTRQRVTDMVPVAHDFSGSVVFMAPDAPRVEPGVPKMLTDLSFHQGEQDGAKQGLMTRRQKMDLGVGRQVASSYQKSPLSPAALLDIVV